MRRSFNQALLSIYQLPFKTSSLQEDSLIVFRLLIWFKLLMIGLPIWPLDLPSHLETLVMILVKMMIISQNTRRWRIRSWLTVVQLWLDLNRGREGWSRIRQFSRHLKIIKGDLLIWRTRSFRRDSIMMSLIKRLKLLSDLILISCLCMMLIGWVNSIRNCFNWMKRPLLWFSLFLDRESQFTLLALET